MRAAAVDAPDSAWPSRGTLELRDVRLRYTPGGPLVLRGVSLAANAGERVGIVGRTGAGKSSLLLAIFRMAPVEGQARLRPPRSFLFRHRPCRLFPVPSPAISPQVLIDGLNVLSDASGLSRRALRARLGMIPQAACLLLPLPTLAPAATTLLLCNQSPPDLAAGRVALLGLAPLQPRRRRRVR